MTQAKTPAKSARASGAKSKVAKSKVTKTKVANSKATKAKATGSKGASAKKRVNAKTSADSTKAKGSAASRSTKRTAKPKTQSKASAKAQEKSPKKAQDRTKTQSKSSPQTRAKKSTPAELAKPALSKPDIGRRGVSKVAVKKSTKSKRKPATRQATSEAKLAETVGTPLTTPATIGAGEYKKRRAQLMNMMSPGAIALIPGASPQRRNRDIHYPFRQDSDFYYLTGFAEPESLLVLAPGRAHGQEILFCPDRDPRAERWDGERMGPERATQMLQVDDAFPSADVDDILPGLLEGRERIYITLGEYPDFDSRLLRWVANIRQREAGGAHPPGEFVELKHLLHEMRLFKSAKEIGLMKRAAQITSAAHIRAMRACEPGMSEGVLEAELNYEFMRQGARAAAYPSIVGGGENGCVMHYIDNTDTLKKNDLVLIDAGCEYEHYAADVTRTFPVSGRFNSAQRDVYEIVLAANQAAIAACRPGQDFNAPHEAAVRVMIAGLIDLGILEGPVEARIDDEEYLDYCPHKTSHWLGIDVHDVGDYRIDTSWRELEPGMVLTIEPGIYIPRDDHTNHLPARYRGMGIRIEDDVLITKKGCEVLTSGVPKLADEVEAVMAADSA